MDHEFTWICQYIFYFLKWEDSILKFNGSVFLIKFEVKANCTSNLYSNWCVNITESNKKNIVLYRPPYQVKLPFSKMHFNCKIIADAPKTDFQHIFVFYICVLTCAVCVCIITKHSKAHHSILHGCLAGVVRVEGHDLHMDQAW